MTIRGRLIRRVLVPVVVAGLLVPVAGTTSASAATSSGHVAGGDDVLGEGWFYSGNDGEHGDKGGAGFNSFILLDLDCADGFTVGVSWRIGNMNGIKEMPKGECDDDGEYGFTIDFRTSEIREMTWHLWAKDADGEIRHRGEEQEDWLGSLSDDPADRLYFEKTAVFNDEYDGHLGITASVWPTEETKETVVHPPMALNMMGGELRKRTPLPEHFSDDQVESMYKQLVCHAQLGYWAPDHQIGDSWDLESWRANIDWEDVWLGAKEHECNWSSDGDWSGNIPPSTGRRTTHRLWTPART